MSETPNLSLPYLAAGQAQKHVTLNEIAEILDANVHLSVLGRTLGTPPVSPPPGSRYLLPAGASGAWQGHSGKIASWNGFSWRYLEPRAGWLLWDEATASHLVFDGTAWMDVASSGSIHSTAMLGINTLADSFNRLSVKADGVLFSCEDTVGHGDIRASLNKALPANTASQIYQTGNSGRAETGLMGNDQFAIKVSADGATWREALTVNHASGQVSFPNGVSGLSGGGGVFGQCRLDLAAGNLRLLPLNGNILTVDGAAATIPAMGVTLAATGLAASTTYYIYAVASAGTVTSLEASTTGWATHTDGTATKSGDASRALVGMARTISGPSWVDSAKQRFVRSWFNRRTTPFSASFSAIRSTTSTSYVEINIEARCEFLAWAGETVTAALSGSMYNTISTASTLAAIGINGTTPTGYIAMTGGNSQPVGYGVSVNTLPEGYNYVTHLGKASAGTAMFGYIAPEFNGIHGTVCA